MIINIIKVGSSYNEYSESWRNGTIGLMWKQQHSNNHQASRTTVFFSIYLYHPIKMYRTKKLIIESQYIYDWQLSRE